MQLAAEAGQSASHPRDVFTDMVSTHDWDTLRQSEHDSRGIDARIPTTRETGHGRSRVLAIHPGRQE
jgi:hypothetical protein